MSTTTFETRRTELAGIMQMVREGWAHCDAAGEPRVIGQAYYDRLEAEYNALVAKDAPTEGVSVKTVENPQPLHLRPAAGSRAANQYGEFQVKYASAKQTAFIKSLLEGRDLTALQAAGSAAFDLAAIVRSVQTGTVNRKAASAIIDTLLRQPEKARPADAPVANAASEKQVAFIARLAAERGVEAKTGLTKGQASAEIDRLMALPKAAPKTPAVELDKSHTGPWIKADLSVYRVYFGRQSGNMLAKVWVPGLNPRTTTDGVEVSGDWEYAGKADRFIDATRDHKLTRDEAAAWGQNSANCCVCGADLDDPTSIDRGIGPVCWAKMA